MIRKMLLSFTILIGFSMSLHAYEYQWISDETFSGQEMSSIVEPLKVIILDDVVEIPSTYTSLQLKDDYGVHLVGEWTYEQSYALYQTFKDVPQKADHGWYTPDNTVWKIEDTNIQNDIEIEYHGDVKMITVSLDAFNHSNPVIAGIDGVRGRYFSKRLHRVIVRFVTDNGADRWQVREILNNRYNVKIHSNGIDYEELTKHTTGEHAGRFQPFKDEELVLLITALEEMPSGMITTPGLKYIIRRLDGTPNPRYPLAPAIAWTGTGYIEFMEGAFKGPSSKEYIYRLILHEKAHFMWSYLFDDHLKQDWIELGQWIQRDDESWYSEDETRFVSAYAHGHNPNEDMAETISYYIINPDKLRAHAPEKYKFLQDRIMHGARYISKIREDLTFRVYNLYPDYIYPGRIVRLDIKVEGDPYGDKTVTIEVETHTENPKDFAAGVYLRIFSENENAFKFFDMWLSPIDEFGNKIKSSSIFRGSATVSKYMPHGYYQLSYLNIRDTVGNNRYSSERDFGWKLYINNPLADYNPPKYVPNSAKLSISDAFTEVYVDANGTKKRERYQIVTATWKTIEDIGFTRINANIRCVSYEGRNTYSRYGFGKYDEELGLCVVEIKVPEHYVSGIYELNYISMVDHAQNSVLVYLTKDPEKGNWRGSYRADEEPPSIEIVTSRPDITPPVLDINSITIDAKPSNPDNPNGQTNVLIEFRVKDDISGYNGAAVLRLRDPQGGMHTFSDWEDNDEDGYEGELFHSLYYNERRYHGDPSEWNYRKCYIVLPVGSHPGIWGLAEIDISDKASNYEKYDFTEIVRFEIIDEKYDLADVKYGW